MSKIKMVGNAVVITSSLKVEDIEYAQKYAPDLLKVFSEDEEGNKIEVFGIGLSKVSDISKYGILFGAKDDDGYAQVTKLIPESVTDKKQYLCDQLFEVISQLNIIECEAPTDIASVKARFEEFANSIETESTGDEVEQPQVRQTIKKSKKNN